jgi:monoamine oxidase
MARSLYGRLHGRFGARITGTERQHRVRDRIARFAADIPIDQWFAPRRSDVAQRRRRVTVVGGGFAGLMAGSMLARHFDVTVFEARDRIGGRVWSQVDPSSKRVIEAGAELIGYDHPMWLALAKEFSLGFSRLTTEDHFAAVGLELPMYLQGTLVPPDELEKVYKEMTKAFELMSKEAMRIENPFKPWLYQNAAELDQRSLSQWIGALPVSSLAKAAIEVQFANTNGAPSSRQSYLANLALVAGGALHGKPDDFFTLTETVRCAEGNQILATRLRQKIEQQGGKVALSTPIRRIDINSSDVVCTATDRSTHTADYVVLAVPPSLWPSSPGAMLTVNPKIPDDYYMSMGTAVKYLSRARSRFWIDERLAPSSASAEYGMTWEGTDNQMQAPEQPVELSLFAGGDAATAAIDVFRKDPNALPRYYDAAIAKVYPAYPEKRIAATDFIAWPLDDWTRGGYSCPAPTEVCRVGPKVNAPFAERLHFAGEHVSLAFFGYMEGALQSGAAAARAISSHSGIAWPGRRFD